MKNATRKYRVILLALIVVIQGCCGSQRILGGNLASRRVKYQASIRDYYGSHICSGAIVHQRWTLTTARCLRAMRPHRVHVGSNYLNTGGQYYDIDNFLTHPEFNMRYEYDIGMIKTTPMEFNIYVGSIGLASTDFGGGYTVTATGWGSTDKDVISDSLQELSTKTMYSSDCSRKIGIPISGLLLCTYLNERSGMCEFDGGNPIAAFNVLYGIGSLFINCGGGFPDINTNIVPFRSWINEVIRTH